jgi:MFS family permease
VALFADPRWRKNAIVGMLLACSGVIGLWGIAFFSLDLVRSVFEKQLIAEGLDGAALAGKLGKYVGFASMMIQVGAFASMMLAARVCQRIGRKPFFALALVAAMLSTAMVFRFLTKPGDIWWMLPIMGFCQLSLFAGYAIYLPELFPTRLRSTGTSFCYNVGRFIAAGGPFLLGQLTSGVFAGSPEPLRPAGLVMCSVFLLGLAVLPFAPETNGKPLPE